MHKNTELMGFASIGMSWQDWCSRLDSLIEDVAIDNATFLLELKTLINENAD